MVVKARNMALRRISILLLFDAFFWSVMAAPVFQGREDFLKNFKNNNCSLTKNIVVPKFEPGNGEPLSKLMKPLRNCKPQVSTGDYDLLCQEIYEVIMSISTCSNQIGSKLEEFDETIDVEVSNDVCLGFKESGSKFQTTDGFVSPVLRDPSMCALMCNDKYEVVCKVLLWAHEVHFKLSEHLEVYPFVHFIEALKEDNCSFSKVITAPDFLDNDNNLDFLSILELHLKPCNDVMAFQKTEALLCNAIFHALSVLTTCNQNIPNDQGLKVKKEIHSNICEAFANSEQTLNIPVTDIVTYLQNELVCESLCSRDTKSICQILLWAYEVNQELNAHSAIVEKKLYQVSKEKLQSTTMEEKNLNSKSKMEEKMNLLTLSKDNGISLLHLNLSGNSYHEKISNSKGQDESTISKNLNENEISQKEQSSEDLNGSEVMKSMAKSDGFASNTSSKSTESHQSVLSHKGHEKFFTSPSDYKTVSLKKKVSEISEYNKVDKLDAGSTKSVKSEHMYTNLNGVEETINNPTSPVMGSDDSLKETKLVAPTMKTSSKLDGQTTEISPIITASISSVTSESIKNVFQDNDISYINAFNTVNSLKSSKESSELENPAAYDTPLGVDDQKTFESTYKEFEKSPQGQFVEQESSHFFLYFLCIVALVTGCYIVIHNKQKVIALIVEGRHERRRRPHSASYKKLDNR